MGPVSMFNTKRWTHYGNKFKLMLVIRCSSFPITVDHGLVHVLINLLLNCTHDDIYLAFEMTWLVCSPSF